MPSFDMLENAKLAFCLVNSRTIINNQIIIADLEWMTKIVAFACFPIYWIIQTILVQPIGYQWWLPVELGHYRSVNNQKI